MVRGTEREGPVVGAAKSAASAWGALSAFILLYDIYAMVGGKHETMSGTFWRTLENNKRKWALFGVWSVVTKHLLFPKVAPKADPFNVIAYSIYTLKDRQRTIVKVVQPITVIES